MIGAIAGRIVAWITGDLVGQLTKAYEIKKQADTEEGKLVADALIKNIEAKMEGQRQQASVVKEGMQHKVFWIPWLIAAVPTAAWFGWGMVDSLFNGSLPDVAELPPQLKTYADTVFANIFYTGAAGMSVEVIAKAIHGHR